MNADLEKGFRLIYAKKGGIPKNKYFEEKIDVIKFFFDELNNIDFLSINDVIIDKNKLVKENLVMSRYLKLKKLYEI